jgi:2-C-methyl-D-erythritol 4-phosphate cytidylyltransferase
MHGVDKTLISVAGRPMLWHSLQVLDGCPAVDAVVLVGSADNIEACRRLVSEGGWTKVREVCLGGPRRQDSVREGLARLGNCDWIVVHDGARPCVDARLVSRGLAAASETGASAAAVPVKDTVKMADADGNVERTLPRDRLWLAQTPQVFRRKLLHQAHETIAEDVTDDATMIEITGGAVKLFKGSYSNIKVTTPEDVVLADAAMARRDSGLSVTGS